MKKNIGILLMLAAVIYIVAVITGGFLKEHYNHIYNAISELSENGTKKVLIVEILFNIYNYLLVIYSVGVLFIFRRTINKKEISIHVMLLLCGLSGIMMGYFPQEARNKEISIVGILHFVWAGVAAITTMLTTILSWLNYRHTNIKYARYSLITFVVIFISGLSNVILLNNNIGNYFGLIERITIGSFIIWLFVTGYSQINNKLV